MFRKLGDLWRGWRESSRQEAIDRALYTAGGGAKPRGTRGEAGSGASGGSTDAGAGGGGDGGL